MRRAWAFALLAVALTVASWWVLTWSQTRWCGVDESVVEKFAAEAGRQPVKPLIDTTQGDILLFVFLLAGAIGGFLAGYCFRELFGPASPQDPAEPPADHV